MWEHDLATWAREFIYGLLFVAIGLYCGSLGRTRFLRLSLVTLCTFIVGALGWLFRAIAAGTAFPEGVPASVSFMVASQVGGELAVAALVAYLVTWAVFEVKLTPA